MFDSVEASVRVAVEWLRLAVESTGAVIIAAGVLLAVVSILRHALHARQQGFTAIRLQFARFLTLALELQLAADILSTSVAPSWDSIGKLAAIAVIRTALNYFLSKEMREEQHVVRSGAADTVDAEASPKGARA